MADQTMMERHHEEKLPARQQEFSAEDVELLRTTICPELTDSELSFFLRVCKARRLNPLASQIYAIKRRSGDSGEKRMTIQTSIDGFRLIAERTGRYAPGREPTFTYDRNGRLLTATSYVKKLVAGEWHEVGMVARFEEFCQTYNGKPGGLWGRMPHVLLSKCAESQALRRAFPEELMGLYTDDEMGQADNPTEERRVRMERATAAAERAPSYATATVRPAPEPAPTAPQTREEIQSRMAVALDAAGQLGMWDNADLPMDRWLDYDIDGAETEQIYEDLAELERLIRYQRALEQDQAAARGEDRTVETMSCSTCGKVLTKGQYEVSLRSYGKQLCPAHQKEEARRGGTI